MGIWTALGILIACFLVLLKCADWFVEGAVGTAERLKLPKMLIGIVLVSLATTLPELTVSVLSALKGHPEMALGNAVGSVIVNGGVALGLAALVARRPIPVNPAILRTTGLFLVAVTLVAYAMSLDGRLARLEGGVLVLLFAGALAVMTGRRGRFQAEAPQMADLGEIEQAVAGRSAKVLGFWFAAGLGGVLAASEGVVTSAVVIARFLGVSEAVIALTVVAVGTSLPEIATAFTAARKGHGEIVLGDILGANILNICWVAGASAVVHPLVVSARVVHLSFPAMLIIVGSMLVMMRTRHRLARPEGLVLVVLYVLYLGVTAQLFL